MENLALEWFNSLTDEKKSGLLEWYNTVNAENNTEDLEILHDAFDELNFCTCSECGSVKIDSSSLSDWGNFQGVEYEGFPLYNVILAHVEGDTLPKSNNDLCIDCANDILAQSNQLGGY